MSLALSIIAALSSTASVNTLKLQARPGVNLSGCEFDYAGTLCPNKDDINWYMDQGFAIIRLP